MLAIPRGGVPIGFRVAKALNAPLDIVVPRKLPIPEEPEAGFGAVTADGTAVLNEPLVDQLSLPPSTVDAIVRDVLSEVRRREETYRIVSPRIDLGGRTVMLVDDGLASGYTMLAAIRHVQRGGAKKVVVVVPCAPVRSIDLVSKEADEVYCLIRSEEPVFAVASYYQDFRDLSDDEVLSYLRRARMYDAR